MRTIGQPEPFDPFVAADMPALRSAIGKLALERVPAVSPAQLAGRLSDAALRLIADRRADPHPDRRQRLDWHRKVASAAATLLDLLDRDLLAMFPPDIGHQDAVRIEMGVSVTDISATLDPLLPDMLRQEAWRRLRDAAQAANHLLMHDPDRTRFLRVLRAASDHEARVLAALAGEPRRPGPRPDMPRHAFVSSVLDIYAELTGREAGRKGWNVEEERRGGPAARFLAAACCKLRDRLCDEERDADPGLAELLAGGSDEEGAQAWIEQAGSYAARDSGAG